MSEYLINGESLTAIADKVRDLSGVANTMSLDAMKINLGEANAEANLQSDLIGQIATALEEKTILDKTQPIRLQTKTVTPTESDQLVSVDAEFDGLDVVRVNAIPNEYVKPIEVKQETIYMPTTSDLTIAAGTYCADIQTIVGDTNLVPANIKNGVSIFGVTGALKNELGVDTFTLKNNTGYDCIIGSVYIENSKEAPLPLVGATVESIKLTAISCCFVDLMRLSVPNLSGRKLYIQVGNTITAKYDISYCSPPDYSICLILDSEKPESGVFSCITPGCTAELLLE